MFLQDFLHNVWINKIILFAKFWNLFTRRRVLLRMTLNIFFVLMLFDKNVKNVSQTKLNNDLVWRKIQNKSLRIFKSNNTWHKKGKYFSIILKSPSCLFSACAVGTTGKFCNETCPSFYCQGNVCARYSGDCLSCVIGRYGNRCNQTCETCATGTTCQQSTGTCSAGCVDGYYGPLCRLRCSTCVRCSKDTGLCTQCADGKFGELCQFNCSRECVPVNSVIRCDIVNADCQSKACQTGFWDTDCNSICNVNCGANSNGAKPCDFLTGRCTEDCVAGYYGPQCRQRCEALCYDNRCHRVDGICAECQQTNPNYTCPSARKFFLILFFIFYFVFFNLFGLAVPNYWIIF